MSDTPRSGTRTPRGPPSKDGRVSAASTQSSRSTLGSLGMRLGALPAPPERNGTGRRRPQPPMTSQMLASVQRLSSPRTPRRAEAQRPPVHDFVLPGTPRQFFNHSPRVGSPPAAAMTATAGSSTDVGRCGTAQSSRSNRDAAVAQPSSARSNFESRLAAEHREQWSSRRTHRADLISHLPQIVSASTKRDLHRFDARLGRLELGSEDRTNSARRQQALLQRLFNLRLSSNCFVKRRLDTLGLEKVVELLSRVCSRYGMRLLTQDDFFLALTEALPEHDGERLTVAESRLLFTLFDDDRSGIVDLDEFGEGLQLLQLSEDVVLLAHCRNLVTDTHPPTDAMVSALEIDLMFSALWGHYTMGARLSARERRHHPRSWFVRLRDEMDTVQRRLWRGAHKGQINVSSMQAAVGEAALLHEAIEDLPENGIRDTEFDGQSDRSGPATPEPDAVLSELARGGRRAWDEDGNDADDDDGHGANSRGLHFELNVRNVRVRGDEFKVPDDERQLDAEEHGNPHWYCRGGQVWRQLDGEVPEPMLDE